MKLLIFCATLVISFNTVAEKKDIYSDTNKNALFGYALKQCLDINYKESGGLQLIQLNDFSFDIENSLFSINSRMLLDDYVEEQTSKYYLDTILVHLESSGDRVANKIFEKCWKFNHSQELKEFIKKI